jgi:aminoglycoside phosphotransferase (APT) family kinase protein
VAARIKSVVRARRGVTAPGAQGQSTLSEQQVPGIDFERLTPWFRQHVAPVDELTATIVGHGRSNLTYRLEADDQAWVLRRPPLSHVLPTAHDMKREYRIISALEPTDVPVPHAIAVCEDASVVGAPFYIMSFVDGMVPTDPNLVAATFDEATRRHLGEELIDTLAAFHAIDPATVGLSDFGKPQGFIARQVRRFTEQLERSTVRKVPEMEELAGRLARAAPEESGHSLVHGDYRLDNCVLGDDGHIAAVLDWEMATLGDPLADVGLQFMYWPDRGAGEAPTSAVTSGAVLALPGFPTRTEAIGRYATKSGRDISNLDFYAALAFFKLAVILEGIHARYLEGGTVGGGFETMGAQAIGLARQGLAVADRSTIAALRG